jgi:hypothetical protein
VQRRSCPAKDPVFIIKKSGLPDVTPVVPVTNSMKSEEKKRREMEATQTVGGKHCSNC